MVCLVTPILKENQLEAENNSNEMCDDNVIFDENFDDGYNFVRVCGGKLIEHAPLLDPSGKYLFIIYRHKVLVYSATTGEWIKDLEEFGKTDILTIEFSLCDLNILIGCSVKGEVVFWDKISGEIQNRTKLAIQAKVLLNFCLLRMQNSTCALITYRDNNNTLKYVIFNIDKNIVLNCPLNIDLINEDDNIIVAAETNYFNYFVISQKHNMLVVDYKNWRHKLWKNAYQVRITVVKVHPTELLVATGDETGKIFLYRSMFTHSNQPKSILYHWHHTCVTSLAFTLNGSGFYSGGLESVLVKWNINDPNSKSFLPRMSGHICHISVGDQNGKIAVATAENSIHILDSQMQRECVLQNFTFVYDNKCGTDRFPVGLLFNPADNTIALNGVYGHLQFFSPYTKSLLFNVDIVFQNKLSTETNKILYDIMVTNADFNINWMATGELWDDIEHLPELRLKFWDLRKGTQNISLNTCIELPHEGGIKSIKFSSKHSADNLLCATLGNDNCIKMWALENSCNTKKKKLREIWSYAGVTKYKNFKATSMEFSNDGSLLAVGYGNTLCIFKSNSLKLKAVLTAPPLYDGSLQKVQICYNKESNIGLVNSNENYKKILDIFKNFEKNVGDTGIVKLLKNSTTKEKSKASVSSLITENNNDEVLFKKILGLPELNLFQKLLVFQKLNMSFSISSNLQQEIIKYLNSKLNKIKREEQLTNFTKVISTRDRFKAKYRLRKYYSRKNLYQNKVNEILTPLLDLLKIEDQNTDVEEMKNKSDCNGYGNGSIENDKEKVKRKQIVKKKHFEDIPQNLQSISDIKSVNFGKGEFAHLIIITTEYRVIIWNILTLRIQLVLKLSVKQMVVDDLTSLCAALTDNNELYIFLPNSPLCVYRRSEMPEILSACWVPKKYQTSTSLNLDWQSFSTLYFLTQKQELICLSSNKDDGDIKESITFINDPSEVIRHSIYDVHSVREANKKLGENVVKIGVPGKSEIKSIIQMASHACAPMNLLSKNLIKSLLTTNDEGNKSVKEVNTINSATAESDSDDESDSIKERKKFIDEMLIPSKKVVNVKNDRQLQKVLKEVLPDNIEF